MAPRSSELTSGATAAVGARAASALLGDAAVVIWNDIADDGRRLFYAWHDREHIPERLAIPGFLRGRRYIRPGHSPEWLTLYEARDVGVVTSPAYLARLNAPTEATRATLPFFRNTSRAVCRIAASLGTSSGGHVLALRIGAGRDASAAVRAAIATRILPRAAHGPGIVAAHLLAAEIDASHVDTAESRTRAFDVPPYVVLVEATTAAAAEDARAAFDDDALAPLGATVRPDGAVYALEICRLASSIAGADDARAR